MSPEAAKDDATAEELGLGMGTLSPFPYATRWDAKKAERSDYGYIGEDADGIWLRRHPSVVLLEHPDLWSVVSEVTNGCHKIRPRDYREKSAFEFDAKMTMSLAIQRERSRRIKNGANDG